MRRQTTWTVTWRTFQVLQILFLIVSSAAATSLKVKPESLPADLRGWLFGVQSRAWWLILASSVLAGVCKLVCDGIGPPWVWRSIQKVLDTFRDGAFEIDGKDGLHKYRVTLFKRCRFAFPMRPGRSPHWPWGKGRHPWSGWLVPLARSGHTAQKSTTVFLAPDDAENAEGIAGKVWAGQWTMMIPNLPDINKDSVPEMVEEYAKEAMVPSDWIAWRLLKGKACPRSLCCISLEVKGEPWGVILLDSAVPSAINDKRHAWPAYEKLMPLFLGELLKRA